jgi:hypothetical protein
VTRNAFEQAASGVDSNAYAGTRFVWRDDWMIGAQLAQGNGWNNICIGTPPYSLFLTGANSNIAPVTGHQRIGVCTLSGGTTAVGAAAVGTQADLILQRGTASFEAIVGFQTLSAVLDEYAVEIGLKGNAAVGGAPDGYGCTFIYDRNNVLPQHGGANPSKLHKWICVVYEGSTGPVLKTAVLTSVTVATCTFPDTGLFHLKVTATGTGAVFVINGVTVATITTNVPTHSLAGSVGITNTASSQLLAPLYLDFTELAYVVNAQRVP